MDKKIYEITKEIKRGSPGLPLKLSYVLTVIKPESLDEGIKCLNFMENVLIPNIEDGMIAIDITFNSESFFHESIPETFENNLDIFTAKVWEYEKK